MKISACIITKNEGNNLDACLTNLQGNVDEIIIVDTGSTDDTKEKARAYTENVFDFKWCDDFSKARNYATSKAKNNWILVVDADEIMIKFNKLEFSCLEKMPEYNVGAVKIINNLYNKTGGTFITEQVTRLFNRNYFHYKGIIHEQIVSNYGIDHKVMPIGIILEHSGYSQHALESTTKLHRNHTLLKLAIDKTPEDPYLHYQLGKTYSLMKDGSSACIEFQKAIKYTGTDIWYKYSEDLIISYGYSLIDIGEYGQALELERYVATYKYSADFMFLLGLIYMNNAMFSRAVECFKKCLGINEARTEGVNSFKAWYNIGVIYEVLGLREQAITCYKKCGDFIPAVKRIGSVHNK